MELTTNQSPLKRCIVLMKMNGMEDFDQLRLKTLSNEYTQNKRSYAALRYKELILFVITFRYGFRLVCNLS
jgi:hypothetical protein